MTLEQALKVRDALEGILDTASYSEDIHDRQTAEVQAAFEVMNAEVDRLKGEAS